MKIAELSARSGVPLPTIKFYIREGLLQAGEHTAKNQAAYTSEHLARLALIVALKEDAGLPVASIARALRASDAARDEGTHFIGAAVDAIERPSGRAVDARSADYRRALADVRGAA